MRLQSIFFGMALLAFSASTAFGTTYYWDGSQSTHWGRAKNWNSGGAGGHPNENSAVAWLVYNGYPRSGGQGVGPGKMDVSINDNDSSTVDFTVSELRIATESSDEDWVFSGGSSSLTVRDDMAFDIRGSGSATINCDINIGSRTVDLAGQGTKAVLNGELIGDSSSELDAHNTFYRDHLQYYGGGLTLNANNNDNFLGTVRVGLSKVEVAKVNGLRNATVYNQGNDKFTFVNNALLGALTGTYSLTVDTNLKIGNKNSNFTFGGNFKGLGNIRKVGTGTMTVSGGSDFTGVFYVDAGVLKFSRDDSLEDAIVWNNTNNGLNLNGYNPTFGGLGGAGAFSLGNSTLTLKPTLNVAHLGVISGGGSIVIDGTGTQELFTGNTYSGGTTLRSGTLSVNDASDLGTGTLTYDGGSYLATTSHSQSRNINFDDTSSTGTLNVEAGNTLTWSGTISGNAGNSLTKSGSGHLALTSNNGYPGTFNVNAGTMTITQTALKNATVNPSINNPFSFSASTTRFGALTGSSTLTVASGKILQVGENDSDFTYSGELYGSGSFRKAGSGTMTYSGLSLLSGLIRLNEGTLDLTQGLSEPYIFANLSSLAGSTLEGECWVGGDLNLAGNLSPGGDEVGQFKADDITITGTNYCTVGLSTSDVLIANGALDISGATLRLNFKSGAPAQSSYTIATAAGGIVGTYANITGLPGNDYRLEYTPTQIKLIYDNTDPELLSVTLLTPATEPTATNAVQFALHFNENVTGLDPSDFTVNFSGGGNSYGTKSFSGNGTSHVATVSSISGNGTLTFSLAGGAWIRDEANNRIDRSFLASGSVLIDQTPPTVDSITTAATSPTNGSSIAYTVTFSEPVIGFDALNDLQFSGVPAAGATISNPLADSQTFHVQLTEITGDGSLSFAVKTNQVQDAAGLNLSGENYSLPIVFDGITPTATININGSSPTNSTEVSFTLNFNDLVQNLDTSDLAISYPGTFNAPVLSGTNSPYRVTISNISGDGLLTLGFSGSNNIADDAGNPLGASSVSNSIVVNNIGPTAAISAITASPTNLTQVSFNVQFSENVLNFNDADLEVDYPGSMGAPVLSGNGSNYTVTISSISGDGELELTFSPTNNLTDIDGNILGASAASAAVTINNIAPTVILSNITTSPTPSNTVDFAFDFSEDVQNFDLTDLDVATSVGFDQPTLLGSGSNYVLRFENISGDGYITITSPQDPDLTDGDGNEVSNFSAISNTVIVDAVAPQINLLQADLAGPTNTTAINFAVKFSEPVDHLDSSDFDINFNGSYSGPVISGSANSYTVSVSSVSGEGLFELSVNPSNDITDVIGRALGAATDSDRLMIDQTAPALISFSPRYPDEYTPTNATTYLFDIAFSETVTNFTLADLEIMFSGTFNPPVLTSTGLVYTAAIDGVDGDDTLSLQLKDGYSIYDLAGNSIVVSNGASGSSVIVDTIAPEITAYTESSITRATNIYVELQFDEPVINFDLSDLVFDFAGGTYGTPVIENSNMAPNGGLNSVEILIGNVQGDGLFTLALSASNDVVDTVFNPLATGGVLEMVTVDQTAPELLDIQMSTTSTTLLDQITFSYTFSEQVNLQSFSAFNIVATGLTFFGTSGQWLPGSHQYQLTVEGLEGNGTLVVYLNDETITDMVGHSLSNALISPVITHLEPLDYASWSTQRGLTPANDSFEDDPDGDGRNNLGEFAFDTDPQAPGDEGKSRVQLIERLDKGGKNTNKHLVYFFPVRTGVSFSQDPLSNVWTGPSEGFNYFITGGTAIGSNDLRCEEANKEELDYSGLPALNPGWQYKAFWLIDSTELVPSGFMKVKVEEIPEDPGGGTGGGTGGGAGGAT